MDEKKKMSLKDVIVCRVIWYVMTLLSLVGLSISIHLLWPPSSSSSSKFISLRDVAVSVTTFYLVTLLRYLFFTDPPSSSSCHRVLTTTKERILQCVFSELTITIMLHMPLIYSIYNDKFDSFVWHISLFAVSLSTGAIGVIQLSDKFRMEMVNALVTLFSGWFLCLGAIYYAIYYLQQPGPLTILSIIYGFLFVVIIELNLGRDEKSNTSSVYPLPTKVVPVE